MVFSSFEFLFVFLPIVLIVFGVLDRGHHERARLAWLLTASLFFYAFWNPIYLPLLLGSVALNYAVGEALRRRSERGAGRGWLLAIAIAANLSVLGVYKYAGFISEIYTRLVGGAAVPISLTLPLAISFFTFQQIAYLVETARGSAGRSDPLAYSVFITFFPQLIAGPIIRHDETLVQLTASKRRMATPDDRAVGATLFVFGLAKKVLLADPISGFANTVFAADAAPTLLEAWGGALAYSLQIYFDFSGYSDMAIGGARLFGIRLPLNFDSPYRAASIIDFWRRWHVTLSRFLRDYLYIGLGGNRHGAARRYLNLMITMLLGGLWHGAGWSFVLWGGMHGLYLLANHAWRAVRARRSRPGSALGRGASRFLTFIVVTFAWVVFRAEDTSVALQIWQGMLGWNGAPLPASILAEGSALAVRLEGTPFAPRELAQFGGVAQLLWTVALLVLACAGPNSQQLMRDFSPVLDSRAREEELDPRWTRLRWRPSVGWALVVAAATVVAVANLERSEEFLYFQF